MAAHATPETVKVDYRIILCIKLTIFIIHYLNFYFYAPFSSFVKLYDLLVIRIYLLGTVPGNDLPGTVYVINSFNAVRSTIQ